MQKKHTKLLRTGLLLLGMTGIMTTSTSHAGLRSWARESVLFFKAFLRSPKEVGAVFACSPSVGKELIRYLDQHEGPGSILEVGAGSGTISQVIADNMRSGDRADLVEIDSGLCQRLHERFDRDLDVNVECCSILDWDPGFKYDLVVCTLPFVSFEAPFIKQLLQHIKQLTKPGGRMSHVEYLLVSNLKRLILFGDKGRTFRDSRDVMNDFLNSHGVDKAIVWRNLPPINIFHTKL